jgi:hypothetical protein
MAGPWEAYQQRGPWEAFRKPQAEEKPEAVGPAQAAVLTAGRWFDQKATGLRDAAPEPVRKAVDWVGQKLGMAEPPSIDPKEMAQKDAAFGQVKEQNPKTAFATDLAMSAAVQNPLGMAVLAATDPGTAGERATRAALSYGAGKAGEYGAGKVAQWASNRATTKAAERTAAQTANAARDATVREAQAAGYVLPPTHIKPSLLNRAAEGFAGKLTTQQAAAVKNEPITQSLAKKALSIPDDVPLTVDTIKGVRGIAGQVYEQVKRLGPVQADDVYMNSINGILGEYRSLVAEFPSQKVGMHGMDLIETLAKDLSKPSFSSSNVVELVKRLRHDGFKNVRNMDPEKATLGRIQVKAQEALEDLIERNLAGKDMSLETFRRARTLIAKSYTVEKALEESTGKVVASKIGREFANGKPLTGELATIGKVAQAFPKAVQNVNTSMPGLSPLDYFSGLVTGGVSGNPLAAATMFARPAVRSALLSKSTQKGLLSGYAPSTGERLMALAGRHPDELEKMGGLLGALSGLQASR